MNRMEVYKLDAFYAIILQEKKSVSILTKSSAIFHIITLSIKSLHKFMQDVIF